MNCGSGLLARANANAVVVVGEAAMKEKVVVRKSTMEAGKHWLEIEHDGKYYVSLRTAKDIVGGKRVEVSKVVLEGMTHFAPGVIVEVGPLHFYRTPDDVRVSFDEEDAMEGLSGFDILNHEELVAAIEKVVGNSHEVTQRKSRAAPKSKRHVASARKKRVS